MGRNIINYWHWLVKGSGGRPGYKHFLDRWLLVHFAVGFLLAEFVPLSLADAANTVLLPLAGIFIGLCFAWGGNASALLQTKEMESLAKFHDGGLEEYVFVYQSAILVLLISLCLWGISGLGLFDQVWPKAERPWVLTSLRIIIFAFSSLTLRECWHVVLGVQLMLLSRYKIRQTNKDKTHSNLQ